jgi:isopentenyldiphosphate isomerase
VVGCATRGECHCGTKLLHPVVHLHLFDSAGRLYLQHRPLWKDIQPGKWDTAVGGHVDYGEEVEAALCREVREELGITEAEFKPLFVYPYRSTTEYELVNAYYTVYDGPISPDPVEVDEGKFWPLDEIKNAIGKEVLTPNFEMEFEKVLDFLKK